MTIKKEDVESGRLVYSCNCGWIDTGHADPASPEPFIGAASLWEQISNESGPRSLKLEANGFKVTFVEGMGKRVFGIKFSANTKREYFVNCGLSDPDKRSVALAIFLEVSYDFEALQGTYPYAFWSGGSSFSQEDLISDLIGFYRAVLPDNDYMEACNVLDADKSLKVFSSMTEEDRNRKNDTLQPVYYECSQCTEAKLPSMLQTIKPAKKGELFRLWSWEDKWGSFLIRPRFFMAGALYDDRDLKVRPRSLAKR
jgi:hypothetical protein